MSNDADSSAVASEPDVGAVTSTERAIEKWRRRAGLAIAPLTFASVWWMSTGRLSPEAAKMSAVLAAALVLWMGIIISETTSNTASASMVIPVVISLSQAGGVNPVPPALGACLGSSYGFMLPVSTPPNAIVYGSGLVPVIRMIRAGVLFDICGFLVIWVGLRLLCPLMRL